MKFKSYLKDKIYSVILFLVMYLLILLILLLFKVNNELIIIILTLILFFYLIFLLIEYFRKRSFYSSIYMNLNMLDKKYLVLETINNPNFYEGKIFYDTMYEINKSMVENVNAYRENINEFKEYIEMWIHEVKIPISSLILMCHNDKTDKKLIRQINRLDNYIDQVLYYVRSENAEKDFLIKNTELDKIISNVALKNKDDLLSNDIELIVDVKKTIILTDSKWLEFIINQIINNSIKYKKQDSYIKIYTKNNEDNINLIIEDNGIGISNSDLPRVFEKSFTGENGRVKAKSTGMGLYIAKKLCEKLGHNIKVDSTKNRYTKVIITFNRNNYYKMDN